MHINILQGDQTLNPCLKNTDTYSKGSSEATYERAKTKIDPQSQKPVQADLSVFRKEKPGRMFYRGGRPDTVLVQYFR